MSKLSSPENGMATVQLPDNTVVFLAPGVFYVDGSASQKAAYWEPICDKWINNYMPPAYDPDPYRNLATAFAKAYKGTVLYYPDNGVPFEDDGTVY